MSSNRIAKKKKTSVSLVNPIILYERPKDKELKKGDYVNLKCHVVPADPNSNTYEIHVPYIGTRVADLSRSTLESHYRAERLCRSRTF